MGLSYDGVDGIRLLSIHDLTFNEQPILDTVTTDPA
jgi:hypothetical protein